MEEEFKNESDLTSQEVTLSQDTGREVATDQALERHFIEPSDNEEEAVPSLFLENLSSIRINPTEWLVRDFIPLGRSLTGIVGESNCGKSFLATNILYDYVTGKDEWFGHEMYGDKSKRKIVYLYSEGRDKILIRLLGYLQENNLTMKDIEDKILLLDYTEFVAVTGDPHLSNLKTVLKLEKALKSYHTEFSAILIDTLNGFFQGNENDNGEVGKFMGNIEAHLADPFNASVIIIHHTGIEAVGKETADLRPRGATAFTAKLDSLIMCNHNIFNGMEIFTKKQRDGLRAVKEYVQAKVISVKAIPLDSKGKETTTLVIDKSINRTAIQDRLAGVGKVRLQARDAQYKRWLEGLMSRREIPFEDESTETRRAFRFYSKDLIPIMEKELEFTPQRIAQELNPNEPKRMGTLVRDKLLTYQKLGPKTYVYWTNENTEFSDNDGLWYVDCNWVYEFNKKVQQELLTRMNEDEKKREQKEEEKKAQTEKADSETSEKETPKKSTIVTIEG